MSTPTNEQREPSGPPVTPLSKETRDAFLRDHLSFLLSHDAKPDVVKAVEEDDELTGLMVSVSAFMLGYERTVCDREDELSAALSRIEELAKDARRIDWLTENAGEWSLGFVALRGKWYCEGPDDANLDERYPTAREAIDAAMRVKAIRDAAVTETPAGKVIDLMEALKASLAHDKWPSAPAKSAVENSAASSSGANTP